MEPTLENISDYNTLKGEKKRVVYAVIIAGIVLGSIYAVVSNIYATPKGTIHVDDKVKMIPIQ